MTRFACLCLLAAASLPREAMAQDDYRPGPEAESREGIPRGTVTQHRWISEIFPDTQRWLWRDWKSLEL